MSWNSLAMIEFVLCRALKNLVKMMLNRSVFISAEFPKTLTKRIKPLSGVRILIVEDEIVQALALENIIAELGGCVLAIAYGFEQAMKVAKGAQFDCAILDINLGGTLSFAIAELLQQRDVPVLFCTAYADAANVFAGEGPVACLEKPIQKIELRDALLGILKQTPP
jgi:CheY-like chemotaxis protein